ncbi:MAG: helix-turn-helix domain-containing protein [Phycisphaerae bacterium]|jgi:excisionase family DNA binding protein
MAYITIPQLAKMLGVSRVTVYRKVKSGEIAAEKVGRNYVIADSEIDNVLNKKLSSKDKKQIEAAVKKVVEQYGETLRLLGKE